MGWAKTRGFSAYALGPALGLATGPLLARALGPEGRGVFAAIMQPLTLAGAIAGLGVPLAATFFVSSGRDSLETLRRCLTVVAVPCLVTYIGMVLYARTLNEQTGIAWSVYATCWLLIPAMGFIQVLRGQWQGLNNWRRLDIERGAFAIVRAISIVALFVVGITTPTAYVTVAIAAFLIAALLLFGKMPTKGALPAPSYNSLIKYSTAASFTSITMTAAVRLDQLILPGVVSVRIVGFYAVSVVLAEIPMIFVALASREVVQSVSAGSSPLKAIYAVRVYCVGVLVSSVLIASTVDLLVPFVFGAEFQASALPAKVLCLGAVAYLVTSLTVSTVVGFARPGLAAVGPVVSLMSMGIAYFIVADAITVVSAAWIWSASQFTGAAGGVLTAVVLRSRPGSSRRAA